MRSHKLKYLCRIVGGGTPSKANEDFWKGDIPWVSPKDMKVFRIHDAQDHISAGAVIASATRIVPPSSVLIVVRSGILQHSIPVAINTVPVALNQDMKAFIPSADLQSEFLAYFISGSQQRLLARWRKEGATVESIEMEDLGNTTCPVPLREHQAKVVNFLDRETAKVDDLIAKKELLIERLKEIKKSAISRLATMGTCQTVTTRDSGIPCIGQTPNHWQLLRNKNLLREIDDRSSDGTEELLTVSHITGVSPRRENQQVTMFMAESNEGYKRCLPDDIVINTMWAWMGALGVSIYAGLVSPAYNVYRFKRKADPWYFHHLFRSPQYVAEIGRYSRGVWTSRLRLYPEEFLNMTSPVPPLEEQFKIALLIDEQNKAASKESEMVTSAIALLREYRSALISAAVTGQLDLRQHEAQLEALA